MTMEVTRRSLLRAIPFFGAAAVVPTLAVAKPTGAIIPLDVAELIADWNTKLDAQNALWAQFEAAVADVRSARRWEHPLYETWREAVLDTDSAMGAMLRALRESDLPVEGRAFA